MGMIILQAFLLTCAISADCFVSGFAYGASKIKIPFRSAIIINFICSFVLIASLFCGDAIGNKIPKGVTTGICAGILIILGLIKIFGGPIKKWLSKRKGFLEVCVSPEKADKDKNKVLTAKEAAVIAIALSLDGLAVGLGAGLVSAGWESYIFIIGFSLVTGMLFLLAGAFIGNKIARKVKFNLSWLSGIMLIGIAFLKIFL